MGICIYKIIHDSFLHPVFPFQGLSSHLNANNVITKIDDFLMYENMYLVTELFMITSFFH